MPLPQLRYHQNILSSHDRIMARNLYGLLVFHGNLPSPVAVRSSMTLCGPLWTKRLERNIKTTQIYGECKPSTGICAGCLNAILSSIGAYHGYAMRKILPLCRKTVTCKSKGFLCLFGHNSRIHCFWLKNLNLFSQNITFRVINYLNLVAKSLEI